MSQGQRSTLLAFLRRLVGAAATDSNDAELLERFVRQRDETAFEALLRLHGPLVWSMCRRVLDEEHAAEDAFQATFLVLVRKARSVSKQASIRSWLYGVALRVALRARQQEQLRRRHEQDTPSRCPGEATWQDVQPILDEEIQRLPEKYRLPIQAGLAEQLSPLLSTNNWTPRSSWSARKRDSGEPSYQPAAQARKKASSRTVLSVSALLQSGNGEASVNINGRDFRCRRFSALVAFAFSFSATRDKNRPISTPRRERTKPNSGSTRYNSRPITALMAAN
jgi:RNA polymerase sigma factor (sigma-70 family)